MKYRALKEARMAQGYSQQQLAQLLGLVSRNAYALKENGERRFSVEEGIAVARLLGQSVEELFCRPKVNKTVTLGGAEG